MKKIFIISIFIVINVNLFAKNLKSLDYDWDSYPSINDEKEIKSNYGSAVTSERRVFEVFSNEDGIFEQIFVFHRKVKLFNHDAINRHNKIYVSLENVLEILKIKARFISPSGKVVELSSENIREVENLDNKGNYKIFAIEGAELNGEIEYFYMLKKNFSAFGSIQIQTSIPKYNVETILIHPSKLEYITKGYNGFKDFHIESEDEEDRTLISRVEYIPARKEERYAFYENNLMRFEYLMAYNKYKSIRRTYSWSKAGRYFFESIYSIDKKEEKELLEIMKQIPEANSQESKLRSIENYLKTEFYISEDVPDQSFSDALKNKQLSPALATKIFVNIFKKNDIHFELVLTSKQSNRAFDPDFNGYNYLDDYLIYFPFLKQVIVPWDADYRLGITPFDYQESYGIFYKPLKVDGLSTLAYEIKKLPGDECTANSDSLFINLTVNEDNLTLDADIERSFRGDLARAFQCFIDLADDDSRKEIIRDVFNMGSGNTTLNHYEIEHSSPEDISVNPLLWKVNQTANSLIEFAGEDLLINIGKTIGQQAELYQEDERNFPIDIGILHNYYRRINFTIPDGYKVEELDDLKMNIVMKSNDEVSCIFTSDYKIEGNKLVIISTEYYKDRSYPVSKFEEFSEVINAAADFNKKTILLKKI